MLKGVTLCHDEAWLSFHKPMMPLPSHLLVLYMFGNDLQDYLLHHFPRDQSGADQPVVLWILLALPEDTSDNSFLPVLRNLPQSPWPFKDYQQWPCNDIGQLPQHSWVHPTRSHGLVYFPPISGFWDSWRPVLQ